MMLLFLMNVAAAAPPVDAVCAVDQAGVFSVADAVGALVQVATNEVTPTTCAPDTYGTEACTIPAGQPIVVTDDQDNAYSCVAPGQVTKPLPLPPTSWCASQVMANLTAGAPTDTSFYAVCVDAVGADSTMAMYLVESTAPSKKAAKKRARQVRREQPVDAELTWEANGSTSYTPHLGYLEPYLPVYVLVRHQETVTIEVSGEVAKPGAELVGGSTAGPAPGGSSNGSKSVRFSSVLSAPRKSGQPYDIQVKVNSDPQKPEEMATTKLELVPLHSYHGALRLGVGFGYSRDRYSFTTGNESQMVATRAPFNGPELIVGFAPYFRPRTFDPTATLPMRHRVHPYLGLGVLKASEDDTKVVPVDLLTSAHLGIELALSQNTSVAVVGSAWRGQTPQARLNDGAPVTDLQSQLISQPNFGGSVVLNFHPQQWVRAQRLGKPQQDLGDVLNSRSRETEKELEALKAKDDEQQKKIEANETAAKEAADAAAEAQKAAEAAAAQSEPEPEPEPPTVEEKK
jgi:hypothetical protein